MKLNKNNKAMQSAIRKALSSGAALGGLLAGMVGVAGCERESAISEEGQADEIETTNAAS